MDQDKAFEKYWAQSRKRLMHGGKFESEASLEVLAREVWYGSLSAQEEGEQASRDAARDLFEFGRVAAEERDWFRSACAEFMGVDAPGGDAVHPLKDWLKELCELRATPSLVEKASADELLRLLALKGGPLQSLAEAGALFTKKGEDYNTGFTRDDYFPMGLASYAQMLWVKALRLVSFAKSPRQENFEGPRDTCLDLVSYAAFCADWLKRSKAKRDEAEAQHAAYVERIRP